ncbi:hypothetical protein [Streptomyces qinzhouensis]|uniref:DUF2970 domain-containing protein n=1 Tax=Streptomyces qinzhouensis TaxID=2599401 RepID=A0A5B8JN97_9ACTN|nr:hypothetical protein [Streptomyces qinzhouensis]QDY79103.1 hypothetical protein FQU76_24190 [Streptomyces qinzhouensis]
MSVIPPLARRVRGWVAHPRRALRNGHDQPFNTWGCGLFLIALTCTFTGAVLGWLVAAFQRLGGL